MLNDVNLRKILGLWVLTVVLIILGVILYRYTTRAVLTINTESGASIHVATEPGGETKEIGKGSAKYSGKSGQAVYIEVKKDSSTTLFSTILKKGSQHTDITLKPLADKQPISPGPLSDLYITTDFIYGINPNTNTLSYISRDQEETADVSFIDIPYVDKVDWNNERNFVFKSFSEGVGYTIDGKKQVYTSGEEGDNLTAIDYTYLQQSKKLFLLTENALYIGSTIAGNDLKFVSSVGEGAPRLTNDSQYTYLTNPTFSEQESEDSLNNIIKTSITVYDSTGTQVKSFNDLQITTEIEKIVFIKQDNIYIALTENEIFTINDQGTLVTIPSYLNGAKDLIVSQGKLLTLNAGGVWEYDYKNQAQYRVADILESEEYVGNSLTNIDGDLYFSTKLRTDLIFDPKNTATSLIYQISF